MSTDEPMSNELDSIQTKINEKTNESLESTRRMLGMVDETKDVGIRTLVMLGEQGEKLDNIEQNMDRIDSNMDEAERQLTNLQKCCGLCVLPWNKKFSRRATSMNSNENKVKTTEPKAAMYEDTMRGNGMPSNGYIPKVTNDAREDEMEENLQLVHSYVGGLKNMAIDMGNVLEGQNKQIDNITKTAVKHTERITVADKVAQKIIRNA
ncbi:unnamed protein product [Didymodactylos carnosus]|uniref:t-SNARE coiled-coil homology domain-containing protein n=1 Tax=Didymodactylos carnosus TaxID=1234261 RepID=A0A813Y814_9BILA|nr:unnamed protein product [Didymodactylos carnosus]CAF3666410.1 unnamed protein product [Didymodactylos carnosus]